MTIYYRWICTLFMLIVAPLVNGVVMAHQGEKNSAQSTFIPQDAVKPKAVSNNKKRAWSKDYFPNINLITQDGNKVKFFDDLIKDKVVAINFIYTSCVDSCPLETARMKNVKEVLGDRVGKDIHFYSISIDPKKDTPEVLKAYKKKFKIGPEWTFLTGNETEIINLRKKLGLYLDESDNSKEDLENHNLNLIIGNQSTGRWMKRSPFENPHILASQLGDWLHNWKSAKTTTSGNNYVNAPKLRQLLPGETLFRTRCSSCHGFGEVGVGPDLMNVTKTRDHTWLKRWLKEPDKMLAEKDPVAISLFEQYKIPMPNMRLTQRDVEDIIWYMEQESKRLQ